MPLDLPPQLPTRLDRNSHRASDTAYLKRRMLSFPSQIHLAAISALVEHKQKAVVSLNEPCLQSDAPSEAPPHTTTLLLPRFPSHSFAVQVWRRRRFQSSEFANASSSGLNRLKTDSDATRMSFRLARLSATVSRRGSSKNSPVLISYTLPHRPSSSFRNSASSLSVNIR